MQNMQNCNQSILSLFDPLRTPATPERDAASPEPSSDKENDGPSDSAGQVTVFFNRIYKHASSASAKMPKGKLIDYDFTVLAQQHEQELEEEEDGGMILDGLDVDTEDWRVAEDNEMEVQDENGDDDTIQIPVSRRQPLADIQLDSVLGSVPEPDPIPVEGSPDSSMWDEADTIIPAPSVTAAPSSAPLANVINSINFASLSLYSTEPSHESHPQDDKIPVGLAAAPEITVIAPEPSSRSPASQTPQRLFRSHLSPSPSTSSFATRRLSPTTSAADPRRASVDLQSSFRLQLQNADMSFDLLNDKISFLGHDSFWAATDDEPVDFRKEERAMMAIAEECESQHTSFPEPVPLIAPVDTPVFSFPHPSQSSTERQQCLPSASTTADPQHLRLISTEVHPNPAIEIPSPSLATTPAPISAAPVPALRIVKKAWKMHDRVESVSSTTSSSSSSSSVDQDTSRVENVPAKRSAPHPREEQRAGNPPVPEMQKARTVIKGVQRPPPGAQLPPRVSLGPAKMRAVSTSAEISRKMGTIARSIVGTMGPPSMPLQRPQATNTRFPTSAFGVTSRLPGLNGISKATTSIPTKSSGPMRPPRTTGSASATARSGLPLPQSRIPSAPSVVRGNVASRLPTASAARSRLP